MGGLGRGGEDVGEEEVGYAALETSEQGEYSLEKWTRGGALTVATIPTSTTTRLKLCCVVRTAFSPGDRSDHRMRPVSPASVIGLRGGEGVGVLVACACVRRVVEEKG